MALNPAQRVAAGLDAPGQHTHVSVPPVGEFVGRAGETLPGAPAPPGGFAANPRLALLINDKATAPKIRSMVNELLAGNLQAADVALKQLFVANPKVGLELFIEMAQFTLPQLKAVAVAIDDNSAANPRAASFVDLQKMLNGD